MKKTYILSFILNITLILALFINSWSLTQFTAKKSAQQKYQQVLLFVGKKQYEQAKEELKSIIKDHPLFGTAYQKLIKVYLYSHGLKQAQKYFENNLKQHPENPFLYFSLGWIFERNKKLEKAAQYYQKSIELAPDFPRSYEGYLNTLNRLKKLDDAPGFLNKILVSNPDNATIYYGFAYFYQLQKDWKNSIKNIDKALEINKNLLPAYVVKGAVYWYTSKFEDFIKVSQAGLRLAQKQNDSEFQCKFLGNMGLAYLYLANYSKALNYSKQALKLAQKFGMRKEESRNLGNIGVVYQYMGDLEKSLDYYQQALTIATQIGDKQRQGLFLRNIGTIYGFMNEYEQALFYLRQSVPIIKAVGDENTESLAYWSLGSIDWSIGNYYESLKYYQKALQIARKLKNHWAEERYLNSIGLVYWNLGQLSKALDYFDTALKLAKKIGDKDGEGICLGNIAIIYEELGNLEQSLERFHKALILAEEINNKTEQARHLANIGTVYHQMGKYDKALKYYQQSLDSANVIGAKEIQETALGNIGDLLTIKGEYAKADLFIRQALALARKIKNKRSVSHQLIELGDLKKAQNDHNEALKYYQQALQIAENIYNPDLIWRANTGIAVVCENKGEFQKSLIYYERAINKIESMRSIITSEQYKTSFFENKINVYVMGIQLLNHLNRNYPDQNYDERAFNFAERAKARTLLDILNQGKIFQNLKEIPPGFREKFLIIERKVEDKHQKLSDELGKSDDVKSTQIISTLDKQIQSLERERATLYRQLKQKYPQYYRLANPKLLGVVDIQNNILKKDQTIIEYLVAEENIYLWLISKNNFAFRTINLTKETLKKKLAEISPLFESEKELGSAIIDHRWANMRRDLLHDLYRQLLGDPAAQFLKDTKELIIVPDGILFYFPFEILVTEIKPERVRYLVEDFSVFYAPSASLLNPELRKNRTASQDLLALGNPDFQSNRKKKFLSQLVSLIKYRAILRGDIFQQLPNAELEVKEIAEHFKKATLFVGKEASEENFKRLAGNYRYLHFATHFLVDDKQPMYSKIILSQSTLNNEDGFLQTFEIYNLRLNAELAVLSGCNSGLGEFKRGEGIIGMTRAFLYAGVPDVVVSLWPVADESTAILMKQFYRYLKDGADKSKALQQAKIHLINSADKNRDPFYWAPFVLISG